MDDAATNVGLLLLRLVLGFVLFAHATQKTFGWFSGPGLAGQTAVFERLGQRPARLMVVVAAVCEASCAVLVTFGVLTPLGAAIGAGTMLVAGSSLTITSNRLWAAQGGGEYPYLLSSTLLALGFLGPGGWSIDKAISAIWYDDSSWRLTAGLGVAILALVAAIPPVLATLRSQTGRS
ncbi:DoxX family protein [Nocardioides sp. GCM10030258]|uniref:DoxX family protein n=1 Tax=unclassified Nocardioides TaxID=2615069 RepID=UPI00360A165B